MKHFICLASLSIVVFSFHSMAADWPVWRGMNSDGISTEKGWNARGLKNGANELWSIELGRGYAAVTVQQGKLYAIGNDGKQDTVRCLNAKTGEELWSYSYACDNGGGYKGPRATPILNGPAVFTFSQDGQVHCLNASSGKMIWTENVSSRFGAKSPKWKHAATPRVMGQLLILNAGRNGLALKKQTGKKAWGGVDGISGYASPVPFKIGNNYAVALFAEKEVLALDALTGKKLWTFPWETKYNVNAADPIILDGQKMFISSGYGRGCALLDYSSGSPRKVWENKSMSNHFSSSVAISGYIYGIDGNAGKGKLKCLDLRNGSVKWEHDTGFGALLGADGKLIILNESGKLFIADASPAGFKAHSSAQTSLTKTCWTMPVLSDGLLYCRNDKGKLICVKL